MPVVVSSIPGVFAGEVSGIDCAAPLSQSTRRSRMRSSRHCSAGRSVEPPE